LRIGFLSPLAKAIEAAPPDQKSKILLHGLSVAYTPDYLAGMFLDRYSKIVHVRDFTPQIDESIRAYFSGYKSIAVTGLLPVLEGIIRKIATRQGRGVGNGTAGLKDELNKLVEEELASPNCYGERVVLLETFRDFVRDKLLKNTATYSGSNEFNRHGILHGIYVNYGEDVNFFRLVTLLDLLCFSIGLMEGGVSMFGPTPTPESLRLADDYRTLSV
jgi:hypothetical protein